jgi:hypothetical protein
VNRYSRGFFRKSVVVLPGLLSRVVVPGPAEELIEEWKGSLDHEDFVEGIVTDTNAAGLCAIVVVVVTLIITR